jgi:parallel beta-helix repeat protein
MRPSTLLWVFCRLSVLAATVACLMLGAPAQAGDGPPAASPQSEFQVCPSGCAYSAVQAAVDAAQPGDVIKVAAGTYTDVSSRQRADLVATGSVTQVVYINKTVTIRGGYTTAFVEPPDPAGNPTVLDAQGKGRVLYIVGKPAAGQAISPTIEGLSLVGGSAAGQHGYQYGFDVGGGVYVYSATATLSNNVIARATGYYGAGVFVQANGASLIGNIITGNVSSMYGGGVYVYTTTVTLSNNIVTSNTAAYRGGGIYLGASPATLTGNEVNRNTAGQYGGGLYLEYSLATLSANEIATNTVERDGGGLYLDHSAATLTANTVMSNTASSPSGAVTSSGGGMYLFSSNNGRVTENSIISNTAKTAGGGSFLESSTLVFDHNTLSRNLVPVGLGCGGGLQVKYGTPTLSRNTFDRNKAPSGGGLCLANSAATLSHNLITNNTAVFSNGGGADLGQSAATLDGNIVSLNWASFSGGGLHLAQSSNAVLVNNVIADNHVDSATGRGSGLSVTGSSPRLAHNTIAANTGGGGYVLSGVFIEPGYYTGYLYSSVTMTNNIVISHSVGITVFQDGPGINSLSLDSTLWGNELDQGGTGLITRTHDYTGNPAFAAPGSGDYHIASDSAARDRGIPAGVATDLDEQPRPNPDTNIPDLGADEWWAPLDRHIFLPVVLRVG